MAKALVIVVKAIAILVKVAAMGNVTIELAIPVCPVNCSDASESKCLYAEVHCSRYNCTLLNQSEYNISSTKNCTQSLLNVSISMNVPSPSGPNNVTLRPTDEPLTHPRVSLTCSATGVSPEPTIFLWTGQSNDGQLSVVSPGGDNASFNQTLHLKRAANTAKVITCFVVNPHVPPNAWLANASCKINWTSNVEGPPVSGSTVPTPSGEERVSIVVFYATTGALSLLVLVLAVISLCCCCLRHREKQLHADRIIETKLLKNGRRSNAQRRGHLHHEDEVAEARAGGSEATRPDCGRRRNNYEDTSASEKQNSQHFYDCIAQTSRQPAKFLNGTSPPPS